MLPRHGRLYIPHQGQLEQLILQFQKLGTTSTQIILSTPVNHGDLEALML